MKTPKNTGSFTYFNANPKGKKTSDCICRAICTTLQQPYDETMKELIDLSLATGYEYSDVRCYGKYLQNKGFIKQKQPRKNNGKKYSGQEFVKIFKDVCVANIGGNHAVCIKDGKILDIWDSSEGCIGNYWIKQNSQVFHI